MIDLWGITLLDLLPPNLRTRIDFQVLSKVIEIPWRQMVRAISAGTIFTNVRVLSDLTLNALAYDLHIGYYDPTLPRDVREVLVGNAMPWHRTRGTKYAVASLVSAIFGSGAVQEWFEYGGEPYYFKVITGNLAVTGTEVQNFAAAVKSAQNVRSWMDPVEINTAVGLSATALVTTAMMSYSVQALPILTPP